MKNDINQDDYKVAKREFDLLKPVTNGRIRVTQATPHNFYAACELGSKELPSGVSRHERVDTALRRNKHNAYLFWQGDTLVGLYAMLMLTPIGLERLLLGEFDSSKPDPICLTTSDETPAAIYMWATVARGLASEGIRHMSQILQSRQFRKANLYSIPNTEDGVRFNRISGALPVNCQTPGLYRYIRLANRELNEKLAA